MDIMKILTVDIGTGTQDIFLYDSRLSIENGFKLVVPSPTMIIRQRIMDAARAGQDVLLHGVIMGGGPSAWAAEAHLRAGLRLFATPGAARTINDDLEAVQAMGITLVSEDEALSLDGRVQAIEMRDFDFDVIASAFAGFGVGLERLDALALAVFDHGDAPPGISDRQFRFDYLDERIRQLNRLETFAFNGENIPAAMTRLRAVAACAKQVDAPLVVMDTAPAAVLGALLDPVVDRELPALVANIGNFHALAFRLGEAGIEGVFEHHTGLLDIQKLDRLLHRLADGSLAHAEVFGDHGHGALVYQAQPLPLGTGAFDVAVTGPRRGIMNTSSLRTYNAVPFGDMMLAGCFGLLRAAAERLPEYREELLGMLGGGYSRSAPWDDDG
jgi:uncharacterized protein (DUF1786 family)